MIKKKIFRFIALASFLFVAPVIALGQPLANPDEYQQFLADQQTSSSTTIGCTLDSSAGFAGIFAHVSCIIYNTFIPMLFAVAMALFVYGVVQYVMNGADESKREKGKQYMVWGIIGLTVMVSVWGLVALLGGTFGLDSNVVPQLRE